VPDRITVIGVLGAPPALDGDSDLIVGGREHIDALSAIGGARVAVIGRGGVTLEAALEAVADARGRVCVLASGDPGFFGIVRALAARFGSERLDIRPAPSSVSVAFARLGLPWDDAVVVSAHGRSLDDLATRVAGAPKVAVLCGPDAPPEHVAKHLVAAGAAFDQAAVATRLGGPDARVVRASLAAIADGAFDDRSVLVLWRGDGVATVPAIAWGRDESQFAHRAGMITKSEVRAVVLAKLALPSTGVLWDVGAGSGSVGIDAALLAPGLRVFSIERDPEAARLVAENAAAAGVAIEIVAGSAPDAFAALPDPDRIFVGGGGLDVLDAARARLRASGIVVATYAAVDRAVAAYERLGNLVQVSVTRAVPLAGGVRLAPLDPVFIGFGESDSGTSLHLAPRNDGGGEGGAG